MSLTLSQLLHKMETPSLPESSTDEKVATETTESKEPVTETQKLNNQLKTLLAQIETAQNKRIIVNTET